MNVERRHKLVESLSTFAGGLKLYFWSPFTVFFVVLGVIALGGAATKGWMAPFRIGETWVPSLSGTGGTYLTVVVFCLVALVARALFVVVRWYQLREIIEEFRSRGAYDVNKDGRTDTFADKFLDDV